jgi:hypothetical protein
LPNIKVSWAWWMLLADISLQALKHPILNPC